MAFYQFTQTQKIPASIDAVWDFISSPDNLKHITPEYLSFKVTSKSGSNKMYAGMIITYIVKPLLGIPLKWMTEIIHVKDKKYFVDEQRVGPYKLWHHQHKIEAIEGGVLMTDIVTYIPPFGFIGAIANSIIIKKKLKEIFDYRTIAVEKKFGVFDK
ncbi:MAG: SRPBCC family protein [Bacteroidetes bacterium]|jgi:ligand-binding SRPBCC domain-containing protein|nr:SRPBCC family protein [Bacteroidota bacterium]